MMRRYAARNGKAERMKVSEKSLELNVGAELLEVLRGRWGLQKAYLRGLTQGEEHQEGADFIVELSKFTRIFAFQFKAPRAGWGDRMPYRFTILRHQHEKLSILARSWPHSVYYVLPFYVSAWKLRRDVPNLLSDTWLLPVESMRGSGIFGGNRSKTVYCRRHVASVNPDYKLILASDAELTPNAGVPVGSFSEWYADVLKEREEAIDGARRRKSWIVRGLRVAIVPPE